MNTMCEIRVGNQYNIDMTITYLSKIIYLRCVKQYIQYSQFPIYYKLGKYLFQIWFLQTNIETYSIFEILNSYLSMFIENYICVVTTLNYLHRAWPARRQCVGGQCLSLYSTKYLDRDVIGIYYNIIFKVFKNFLHKYSHLRISSLKWDVT